MSAGRTRSLRARHMPCSRPHALLTSCALLTPPCPAHITCTAHAPVPCAHHVHCSHQCTAHVPCSVLSPVQEALTTRVGEMERMCRNGCAPAMKALVSQRLLTIDERLTKLMISIDGAQVGEGAGRDAKRALTRKMDALGERVGGIAVD